MSVNHIVCQRLEYFSDLLCAYSSFLSNVTDLQSFDTYLHSYMSTGYPERCANSNGTAALCADSHRYTNLFGCSNINLSNTTDLYPRYGMSFVCNSIIQNSIATCGTSAADSRPLCVDSCVSSALVKHPNYIAR